MAGDFCLLFDAVFQERFAWHKLVLITAERMASERQEDATLVLPYMSHLVDEQRLQPKIGLIKIITEQSGRRMKPEIAVRCHGHAPGLK